MSDVYELHCGDAPLLVSLPHDGSAIPEPVAERMTEPARRSPDTDWHVGQLYDFARELGASMIVPQWSRYVVDLNRPSDGHALYPGQQETALVPLRMFDGAPIYQPGREPDRQHIAVRIERYWQPYHTALAGELDRLRSKFERVVLWEGHSIRARVPLFFDGRLPDFNLGSADGASCAPELTARLSAVLAEQDRYSHVVNGRFKGGYITRHYGRPADGVDAVQLELVQATYMDEQTFAYDPQRAALVQTLIRRLLDTCIAA